nr:hypothetical protein [Tanacetum cinerariifolium]GFA24965.1 hypothetical protein [Tanacetum cinerariifolium]
MRYQALKRKPVIEAQARKNIMIYLKNMAGFKTDFFKGEKEIEEEGNKRKGDSLNQDAAKKQRIDEETEELKKHLKIIANDDDDVYTKDTPLAIKSSHHNIYNYSDDSASGKEISLDTLHSGTNVEQSLELMLLKTSRKYAKGLLMLVEDLMLLVQVKAVR